jgi:nucleoside-diphosphate-sugar epimerase
MRILIFGASGFIGSYLVHYATEHGHEVVALCRSGHVDGFKGQCEKWYFGASVDESIFDGVGCAIHLAHDFSGVKGAELTIDETLRNIKRLREVGVGFQIFFSSYSAGKHATSLYGCAKLTIENAISSFRDVIVVRPGLVLGEGGIYGRMRMWAQRYPVIPLPDGGCGNVPIVRVERLCCEIISIIEDETHLREYNIFEKRPISLRQLVIDAASEVGKKPWIISLPSTLVVRVLRAASVLRIPLPVNSDNLEGFLANQEAKHISTLQDEKDD